MKLHCPRDPSPLARRHPCPTAPRPSFQPKTSLRLSRAGECWRMLLCCMLLCCMLLCWRMGEARRERSIAACALVPAMGISCGRARAGMRPMGGDVDGGMAAEGVRRQGSSAPDDSEGDRQVQGAHRRKLPRRRQRPPTTVRSSRGGVVGGEDEKLESGGEGRGGREERWYAGVSGGGVRGSRVALSSLHCATATATTCVRGALGARAPAAADRPP